MSGSQAQRWLLFVCFLILKIIFGQTVEKIGSKNQGPLNTDSKKTTSMWLSQWLKQDRSVVFGGSERNREICIWPKAFPDVQAKNLLHMDVCAKSFSHGQLWDPTDSSLPGSSVHGILQARILECVATSSSRGSSWPRIGTQVSHVAGRLFTMWVNRETSLCE